MFSVIYTPTEGDAIQNYSRLFRRPEGCFLNINDQDAIEECLSNFGRGEDVDYIVVSDGEEVLTIFFILTATSCTSLTGSITDSRNWRPRGWCYPDIRRQVGNHDYLRGNPSKSAASSSSGLWYRCRVPRHQQERCVLTLVAESKIA